MENLLDQLRRRGIVSVTNRRADLTHLLSAERAARGSFYATRVGFVAIDAKGRRIARAHNGFPTGVRETLSRWSRAEKDFYHLHAECAGIFNAARHGYATRGAVAYVTHPPCPGCMRALAAAAFARVVFAGKSLFERPDWRADIVRSLELARASGLKLLVFRDREATHVNADIARTELDLKRTYDALLPQARGAAESGISPPARPESPEWIAHPALAAILACAARGRALEGGGIIVDFRPECRAATAFVQAGLRHVFVLRDAADTLDPRWAVPAELDHATAILARDAGLSMHTAPETGILALPRGIPLWLDATRGGANMADAPVLRLT